MGVQTDQTLPSEGRSTRKRTREALENDGSSSSSAGHHASSSSQSYAKASPPKRPKITDVSEEKRLRRFRTHAPQAFYDVYDRATSQRFFVLGRTRCGTDHSPEEVVELTGSTGNIYHVHIAQQPTCDCPHALAGNQCKHWLFVMSRVLHARFDLIYQLALLDSELREIFANAPPPLGESGTVTTSSQDSKKRKPIEGDCPICFDQLLAAVEAEGSSKRDHSTIVWCRAACGQNMHKQCFRMWSATKKTGSRGEGNVTCPFCRSQWMGDDDLVKDINRDGPLNCEGYVNVADQLGIDPQRGKQVLRGMHDNFKNHSSRVDMIWLTTRALDHSSYSSWYSGYSRNYRRRYRW
ncbi:hypothetical protein M0657_006316 [Pyricularia oryzae]|nr:hypothetical protein M0657_006316 [Pyricularia oryzae]